jgi:hypothetical protein
MFNIPVGMCFNFHTKISQQPTLFISLYLETELLVSAYYGHHQAPVEKHEYRSSTFQKGEGLPLRNGLKYTVLYIYI